MAEWLDGGWGMGDGGWTAVRKKPPFPGFEGGRMRLDGIACHIAVPLQDRYLHSPQTLDAAPYPVGVGTCQKHARHLCGMYRYTYAVQACANREAPMAVVGSGQNKLAFDLVVGTWSSIDEKDDYALLRGMRLGGGVQVIFTINMSINNVPQWQ